LRIFSPLPALMRSRLALMFAYRPCLAISTSKNFVYHRVCRIILPGGRVQPVVCCFTTGADVALDAGSQGSLQLPARHCGRTPPDTRMGP
jgi:hypothetical protein